MNQKEQAELLLEKAREIKGRAYAPYSHFPVGAAVLYEDGTIITGVNIENVSFGATNCAERTALFTGITQGYTGKDVVAIGVSGDTEDFLPPCSICRQVMVELCQPNTTVYLTNNKNEVLTTTVEELVPFAFSSMNM